MNARVGNPSAALVDPGLVREAIGPIPGVAPVMTRAQSQQQQQQQQHTAQGERTRILALAVCLIPIQEPVGK